MLMRKLQETLKQIRVVSGSLGLHLHDTKVSVKKKKKKKEEVEESASLQMVLNIRKLTTLTGPLL